MSRTLGADRGGRIVACMAAVLVLAGLSGLVEPAGAVGAEWSIQETQPKGSSLSSVWCTYSKVCTAVGHYVNGSSVEVMLVERLTGGEWSIQEPPGPTGAKASSLSSVSCTSSEVCTAVGHYVNSSSVEVMLVERLTGGEWSIQEPPSPTGAKASSLSSVSCTSSEVCTAVGHYVNGSSVEVTLVEQWNGKEWSIQEALPPTGAKGSSLSSVSCTSSEVCTAVGHYVNGSSVEVTLVEQWNGKEWSIQEALPPTGAKGSSLSSVSCTSSLHCGAVGRYVNSSGREVTLVEQWNGKGWSIQEIPRIQEPPSSKEAKSSSLSSVSCTSSLSCAAVGRYVSSLGREVALVERWNGKEWAVQDTPSPPEAEGGSLSGVLCRSSEACTGVGRYVNSSDREVALVEQWNGKEWAVQETPSPTGPTNGYLKGVSCTSSAACTAVGLFGEGSGEYASLGERWNGTSWAVQETPSPTGAKDSLLGGVSCAPLSSTACMAVGYFISRSGEDVQLAENWNGTSWAVQETPSPTGVSAKEGYLESVSCVWAVACTAVGGYIDSAIKQTLPLAESWNGTRWLAQALPSPTGAKEGNLEGVSCTLTTACIAVGSFANGSGEYAPLAETRNGVKWSAQIPPSPTGATFGLLDGVSCASSTTCIAVGYFINSSGEDVQLAESWNGTVWSVQATPNLVGVKASALRGVSCASSTACIAVGYFINSSGEYGQLAESWNGTAWSTQALPSLKGAKASRLEGVSCKSSTACTAVGAVVNSSNHIVRLAEDYH